MIAVTAGASGATSTLALVVLSEDGTEIAVEHLDPVAALKLANGLCESAAYLATFEDIVAEPAASEEVHEPDGTVISVDTDQFGDDLDRLLEYFDNINDPTVRRKGYVVSEPTDTYRRLVYAQAVQRYALRLLTTSDPAVREQEVIRNLRRAGHAYWQGRQDTGSSAPC